MTETNVQENGQHMLPDESLGRRLIHVCGSAFPALYVLPFVAWRHVVILLVVATAVAALLELLRLQVGLDLFLFEFLRDYETDSPAAYLLFMSSATAVAVVFDPQTAIPAILMLTLADPIAGVASVDELRRVKRPKALVPMFLRWALLTRPLPHARPLAVVLGGLGAMLAAGVKPTVGGIVLDDDLTIAPAGAVGIWIGLRLSGIAV